MANKIIRLLRKDTQMQIVFLLLAAVLVALFFLRKADAAQSTLIKQLQAQKDLVAQIPAMERQQIVAPVMSDSLSGIIFKEGSEPVAVINNNIVKEGDLVGPHMKVKLIKNNSVILDDGTKEIELNLPE